MKGINFSVFGRAHRALTLHRLRHQLAAPAPCPAGTSGAASTHGLLYVAASALPYHISGYTTRTHELVRALGSATPVSVLTRVGYPWDRTDRLAEPTGNPTLVDGVAYHHSHSPVKTRPVYHYTVQAARLIADTAARQRVAAIQAASNHINALPALLAARRLGLPFVYEMRGLWELSRVSRQPSFLHSHQYQLGLALEALVAQHADHVLVISEQLRQYVHHHFGVPLARMSLLPNCVDPQRFAPTPAPPVTTPLTVGYAGSLLGYEGLDVLLTAVATLRQQGLPCRLQLAGDGEARAALQSQAAQLGLGDGVQFLGKLSPEAARQTLTKAAVVCIPRKPYEVCKIVPPIKLVEALAAGKPVVLPDLPVFRDELGPEPAGLFFRPGDAADLACVLHTALTQPQAMHEMGQRARAHVAQHRAWAPHVHHALSVINQLTRAPL